MDFVQNGLGEWNGLNSESGLGWEFTDGSPPMNEVLIGNASFPILDTNGGAPYYYQGGNRRDPLAGDLARWSNSDSPGTGRPRQANTLNTALIDNYVRFELYLVCRFADRSLYPVAHTW